MATLTARHGRLLKSLSAAKEYPQALKRGRIFNGLAARVNSCPSRFYLPGSFFRGLIESDITKVTTCNG